MKSALFYSKILLFGEYAIIKDSKGLAIPFNAYNGILKFPQKGQMTTEAKKSNDSLVKYYSYLQKISCEENALVRFDMQTLKEDLDKGMYFDSSIPQGYGVGSSGALVAAIYDRYAKDKICSQSNLTQSKLLDLKAILAKMESFFHGNSSGLDPLNSYLSLPILINSKDKVEAIGIPVECAEAKGAVFLLDSGVVGQTAPMVQIFMEKMKNEGFRKIVKEQFITHTNACIDNFLQGNFKALVANVRKLSRVVLNNFEPMIPKEFQSLWQRGIDSGDYFLKLCGSGGGGYILGFTEDFEKAKQALKGHKIELVYRF